MSSSFIVEPQEGVKKDDTLILMVNDDGVISVDQDTLQNLIINQSNATVSVVRLGQTKNDATEGNITLTVDPPAYGVSEPNVTNTTGDSTTLVDPFMEMDPESLERLETALQSEEAKQILGENVTAMLDMLTAEEQVNSIKYSIELDHCYTSRLSPTQTKADNTLPDLSSSEVDDTLCSELSNSLVHSSITSNNASLISTAKQKAMPPKIVKQPTPSSGRPRRSSLANQLTANNQKSTSTNARSANSVQQENNMQSKEDDAEEDGLFSSSESSDSEESFSDGDFGPKPFRRGVRARGGRRGLTTRGGSMSASRRRGSSKNIDGDQSRRLDMEMAAAVTAMKSPEKEDKVEKHTKNKRQIKTLNPRRKDDLSVTSSPSGEPPPAPVETNVLQTTNQVKANLINANMFKGDMILTKPGQNRNANQKVTLVSKQIGNNSNDIKNISLKKQVSIPKSKFIPQNSKVPMSKDGKVLTSPMIAKNNNSNTQQVVVRHNVTSMEVKPELIQSSSQPQIKSVQIIKPKQHVELKKERKKSDAFSQSFIKTQNEISKLNESKLLPAHKKVVKKEPRKSEPHVVETLGPALFSTPDIIRRVGSSANEMKITDVPVTPNSTSTPTALGIIPSPNTTAPSMLDNMDTSLSMNDSVNDSMISKLDATDASILSETLENDKLDGKSSIIDLLQPAFDTASNSTSAKEISQAMEQSDNSKQLMSESGIEGDEHLLATLSMAAKQLPNEEELLAEALLLQETLGVDLENSGLVDPTPEISESILSSMVVAPSISEPIMKTESSIKNDDLSLDSAKKLSTSISTPLSTTLESGLKKESKEPVQIIRGGRVITLPPIEAPATRSKRLQAKTETPTRIDQTPPAQPKVEPLVIKTDRTRTPVSLKKQDMVYEMDDDEDDYEEDEEADGNSESEDDPNRLWCICRQPHNNRFMICCDLCQDWFHGKCVHVTKAMGEQMEQQGIEWVCPNCSKKKNEECKPPRAVPKKQKNASEGKSSPSVDTSKTSISNPHENTMTTPKSSNSGKTLSTSSAVTFCVVCKKEARKSSIYCSDACILAHADFTTTKEKPSTPSAKLSKTDGPKTKAESRIVVYDKRTGKLLTDANAPTAANLKSWLKEHPTYEVAKPKNLNKIQVGGKTVATIQTQGLKTNKGSPGQTKMVFSKVSGSKQTVITAKKSGLGIDNQSGRNTPQNQSKQTTPGSNKTPVLKQTTIKLVPKQQTPMKPAATSTPKTISVKKMYDQKPSTSQQKVSQTQPQQQNQQQSQQQTPPPKKEPEPIRGSVRTSLAELLTTRLKDQKDLTLSEEEVMELAVQIELEMYKYFKDTGAKYKAKYRSLVFNIKDVKNLTLFRKIADRSLAPSAVVKLSPEEMASQELAEWREKETKHQLEMIKKNELDMMALRKSIVVKTHKGEEIIENEKTLAGVDPKTPVQDIVTVLNSAENISSSLDDSNLKDGKKGVDIDKKKKDKGRGKHRDKSHETGKKRRHSRDRDRSRDKKSKKETKHKDKDRSHVKEKDGDKSKEKKNEKKKDKDKKDKHKHSRSHSKNRHKEHKEKDKDKHLKKEEEKKNDSIVGEKKSIEDRLWRHIEDETPNNVMDGNDSDVSDREPSSTVTIKTPDINDDIEKELFESKMNEPIWRGIVHMADLAKFFVTVQNVSGNAKELLDVRPDTLDVVGRINPEIVWDYIGKIRKNATKDIIIVRLSAINDEEKIPYITLYSYLNSRTRIGVVKCDWNPLIKDFYIMPFSSDSKLPSVLLPLDAPDFEKDRQHLLLGIIVVRERTKRPLGAPPPLTPAPKMMKTSTGDSSFTSSKMHEPKKNPLLSKIVPELSSKITLESSSSSDKMQVDDDDEPYSPGEPVDDDIEDENATSSFQAIDPTSTELQRKMEELSRQIEEEKQQIQSMSSVMQLGDAAATLPGLGCDPPGIDPEAYSPSDSRSFTPPPQGLPKLTPIFDKVSDITIPPNLQEILANVKRQETSKVDPYLPPKPGATFLTTVNSSMYKNTESYSPSHGKNKSSSDVQSSPRKETKSTLSSLSDYDLMKKAEEELAALAAADAAAAAAAANTATPPLPTTASTTCAEPPPPGTSFSSPHR